MDVDPRNGLPMSFAPVTPEVRKKNEFNIGQIFPYRTWHSIPSFSTALLNATISAATLAVSVGCLFVSVFVLVPIGLIKSARQRIRCVLGKARENASSRSGKRKCIVINGAR